MLLGLPARDRDYLVLDATVEEFLRAHPSAKPVGKTFPVFILNGQEFSFLRAPTLAEDLLLRDFTVNAMALDEQGGLACHPRALEDIASRTLRPANADSLRIDPLRTLRAARFLAQLPDFRASDELVDAMRAASAGLGQVYADRAGQETRKALTSARPGEFLRLLGRTGCLAPWFAEFATAADIPAGPPPYHDESVLEHTARVMDALAAAWPGDEMTVWMGLCHDIGKTGTPREKLPRHIGHDLRGEAPALTLGERLRLPARLIHAGGDAARWHMTAAKYPELRPATRVDLLLRLKSRGVLREMFRLAAVDHGGDHLPLVQADLAAILAVRLPQDARDQGDRSGEILRGLRIRALRDVRRA